MTENVKKFLKFIWEVVKVVIISLAIIIPVRLWVIQPFFVKGASMEPNFEDGEYLIVNEIGYHFDEPGRGDVIVFRYPKDRQQYFIKRIIGLPGEKIKINEEGIRVYSPDNLVSFLLNESTYLDLSSYYYGESVYELGQDEYFVLGDNRPSSSDSRRWGPVKRSDIIGKAWIRAWPVKRASLLTTPVY